MLLYRYCVKALKFGWLLKGLVLVFLVLAIFLLKVAYLIEEAPLPWPTDTFIYSAYRVKDGTVRVLYLKDSHSSSELLYRFNIFESMKVAASECQRSRCPTTHDPFCSLNGFIATIKIDNPDTMLSHIHLSLEATMPLKTTVLPLIDARPKGALRHYLGVCLQPIFYLVSPKLLIAFFEYWISQGATVFYVYRHSWSPEVQKAFDFYSKNPKITVHLMDWPDLPHVRPDTSDPNAFIRRLEFSLAMADCVYRSRNSTSFLAMTDLDEIVYVKSGQTVKQFVESVAKKTTTALWFASQKLIGASPNQTLWEVLKKPLQSKLIVNAQRTKTINVHEPGQPEDDQDSEAIDAAPSEATLIHFRFDYTPYNGSTRVNDSLARLQRFLQYQTTKVVLLLDFSQDINNLDRKQQKIFEAFDACAAAFKGKPQCKTIHACRSFLPNLDILDSSLIKAVSRWRVLQF